MRMSLQTIGWYFTFQIAHQFLNLLTDYSRLQAANNTSYYNGARPIFCLHWYPKPDDGITLDAVNIAKHCPLGVIDGCFVRYLVKWRFSNVSSLIKHKMPSWFHGEKWVDYGIHKEVHKFLQGGCYNGLFTMMIFRCMWLWVICNRYTKTLRCKVSKHLNGESVGLKISNLTIAQYIDDVQLATKWRFRLLTSISTVLLTCFTVTLWTWSKFYTYSCRNIITISYYISLHT